ncbi:open rectifier potassium channel protein 1 [Anopheles stephensi]|uniref:open rectifier potassium channel protein 1 n=1 Tax=Anopheles stephensi TaxID=30069 RepID=UPI0016589FAA|nr:open rectifier potassium channel protein 1 [Anopheles stephensi]XP_035900151.1 open rectifier potassium channel protein 1 [Anopheles stephensi]XP_035900152.1 open rectifier potassium channel protein 1 [Anopheles stephensi]XP_035900153.1 open rectifier potassium channel protein 1 [Anopheles stephensi]XP_035900154.1 open rectifier potassium channel protein 1 [Anopheles stephensi]XP_035900155.1 open rectifier potassium channel protein 1 [Anopheles stephensi]
MTPKEWFALLLFYAAYLFMGASVFYHIENDLEKERRVEELAERIEINEMLVKYLSPEDLALQRKLIGRLDDYCGSRVTNYTEDEYEPPYVWDFYHSFYFAFIICSTVGYGNISPHNTFGRIFLIFYALIGLPVNGFFFAYVGEFWARGFVRLYRRYKAYKLSANARYAPRRISFIGQIVLYLIPGVIVFIFLPACIFTYFEQWPYDVSVYYSFVTLTTIGFGDYAASFQPSQEHEFGSLFTVYKIFIIFWFFAGIGYIFMILGFIAKGISHKKIIELEKLVASNLKETQHRVWNGVTKDISYLRKILNEVYMLKFKPVYEEPSDRLLSLSKSRSSSCPELSMYRSPELCITRRKRANSESVLVFSEPKSLDSGSLVRRLSDTALNRINREKTFGVQALVQPAELLARVVTALGNITANQDDNQSYLEQASLNAGVNCFSDSQILASERTWSGWSMSGSDKSAYLTAPPMRPRAASDIGLPPHATSQDANEWTWSGGDNNQIQQILTIRQKVKQKDNLLRAALSNTVNFDSSLTINVPPTGAESKASAVNRGMLRRLNPFRKRSKTPAPDLEAGPGPLDSYLSATSKGRSSMFNLPTSSYLMATSRGRGSILSMPPQDEHLLETTTIGDLLRALERMHTDTVTAGDHRGSFADQNDSFGRKRTQQSMGSGQSNLPSLLTLFTPPIEPGSRRGSIKPPLGRTGSSGSAPIMRRPSFRPSNPPSYSATVSGSPAGGGSPTLSVISPSPKPIRRRFSVRPSNLAYPPGHCPRPLVGGSEQLGAPHINSSSQSLHNLPTTTLQRRLSSRPSPLVTNQSSHLTVPTAMASAAGIGASSGQGQFRWRPNLMRSDSDQSAAPSGLPVPGNGGRNRHSSLSNLFDQKR